jgi:hypothetical protein
MVIGSFSARFGCFWCCAIFHCFRWIFVQFARKHKFLYHCLYIKLKEDPVECKPIFEFISPSSDTFFNLFNTTKRKNPRNITNIPNSGDSGGETVATVVIVETVVTVVGSGDYGVCGDSGDRGSAPVMKTMLSIDTIYLIKSFQRLTI